MIYRNTKCIDLDRFGDTKVRKWLVVKEFIIWKKIDRFTSYLLVILSILLQNKGDQLFFGIFTYFVLYL